MESISVNGQSISSELIDNMTISSAVEFINKIGERSNSVVTQLLLDGEEIELDEYATKSISNYTHVEFITKSKASLAFDCLNSCRQYIDIINSKIEMVAELYSTNNTTAANNLFLEVIEITEIFIQLFSKVSITLKNSFADRYKKSNLAHTLEIGLIGILNQIYRAKESADYIALCDLLEYELTDNLTQWKETIIPEIEKLRDN
ncbi:MAG: hypothetical protein KAG61_01060 [Bacteriovoracaceae bacterium]|nr:hypothetical protein [Bacteriovoracaceae bacterium]